jgi:hypothetical protein
MAHQHRIPKTTAFLEEAAKAAGFTMEQMDPTPFLPPSEAGGGTGGASTCASEHSPSGVTSDLSELVAMPSEGHLFRLYVCRKLDSTALLV